jgi:hypothetical protein
VLLHELGHALAYRRFGQRPSITLYAFGGLTQGERGLPPKRALAVSLAGPGAQLGLLGLPLLALDAAGPALQPFWADVVAIALFVNIAWPLFNLLPVLPLDGGNVVSSAVELVRPGKGLRAAQWVSVVVAAVGAVVALSFNLLFAAAFGGLFAYMNWQALQQPSGPGAGPFDLLHAGFASLLAGDVSAGRLAATRAAKVPELAGAADDLRLWSFVVERDRTRLARALALRPETSPASALLRSADALLHARTDEAETLFAWSLQHEPMSPALALAADLLVERGDPAALGEHLASLDDGTDAARLLQAALHHRGHFGAAAAVGAALLQPTAAPRALAVQAEVAADVAASTARAGDLATAASWLAWATRAGWADHRRLATDPDLAALRDVPGAATQPPPDERGRP